jgi:rod shape-determining protein MreD
MEPLTHRGESRLRVWLAPFEGGRARLFVHLALACLLLSASSVASRSPRFRLDLAVLVIVYVALEYPMLRGIVAALVVGWIADLMSGESRGLSMAALVIAYLLVRLVVARITGSKWIMITGVSVFATIVDFIVRFLLESLVGPSLATVRSMGSAIFTLLFGALILGYPCYRLFRFVDNRFRPREESVVVGSLTPRRWM